jgi:uncharacterized protein
MSQPFKLFRLQQLDTQLDAIHARLQAIDTSMKDDHELKEATHQSELADQIHHQSVKKMQQADYDTSQQRIKIEQVEAALYGGKVRNPKELQDLQNELAALKRHLLVLEDRQLESMEEEEQTTSGVSDSSAALQNARDQYETRLAMLRAEQKRLENDSANMESERRVAVSSIDQADYLLYEQLRRERRGVAVARVSDRACSACGSTLNAMLLQAARSQTQLNRCDICGRILYVG